MERIVYEFTPEMLSEIKAEARETAGKDILTRYATTLVDTKAAAQILGISQDTLRTYVGLGKVEAERNAERGKLRFRLSHLLSIDINKIKYKR